MAATHDPQELEEIANGIYIDTATRQRCCLSASSSSTHVFVIRDVGEADLLAEEVRELYECAFQHSDRERRQIKSPWGDLLGRANAVGKLDDVALDSLADGLDTEINDRVTRKRARAREDGSDGDHDNGVVDVHELSKPPQITSPDATQTSKEVNTSPPPQSTPDDLNQRLDEFLSAHRGETLVFRSLASAVLRSLSSYAGMQRRNRAEQEAWSRSHQNTLWSLAAQRGILDKATKSVVIP
jgi:hypothetical protein